MYNISGVFVLEHAIRDQFMVVSVYSDARFQAIDAITATIVAAAASFEDTPPSLFGNNGASGSFRPIFVA